MQYITWFLTWSLQACPCLVPVCASCLCALCGRPCLSVLGCLPVCALSGFAGYPCPSRRTDAPVWCACSPASWPTAGFVIIRTGSSVTQCGPVWPSGNKRQMRRRARTARASTAPTRPRAPAYVGWPHPVAPRVTTSHLTRPSPIAAYAPACACPCRPGVAPSRARVDARGSPAGAPVRIRRPPRGRRPRSESEAPLATATQF